MVFVPNDEARLRSEFCVFFWKRKTIWSIEVLRGERAFVFWCLLAAFGSTEIHIVRCIHPTDDLFTAGTSSSHLSNFWFSIHLRNDERRKRLLKRIQFTVNVLRDWLTWCRGKGWPAAVAADIIAAYCSGVGLCDGIGSLFGRFAGGPLLELSVMRNDKKLATHWT